MLGAKAILNALSENGHAETAYKVAVQDTYPSWGWWIVNGATTLLENWNLEATRDISDNHMMFGEIGGWFFKGLGGIKPDPEAPGFKHILLRPEFRRPRGIRGFARRPLRSDRVGMDAPGQYGDLPRPNPGQQYRNALPAGQRGRREGASAGCRKPYADAQGGQMTLPPRGGRLLPRAAFPCGTAACTGRFLPIT